MIIAKKNLSKKKRLLHTKEVCQIILNKIFNKGLNFIKSFIGDSFYSNVIVPINSFVITKVYISVGVLMSIQFFFHHEKVILSETTLKGRKNH